MTLVSWPELAQTDMDRRVALGTLYDQHVDAVYSYARNRVGAEDAKDVTSDVFMAAARMFSEGRGNEVTIAWLMGVARNRVIDRWRSAQRRADKSHLLDPIGPTLPDDWLDDPRSEDVVATLDALTPRHRELLTMHYVDGWPVRQMARRLGETESATESALKRARVSFRKHYGGADHG